MRIRLAIVSASAVALLGAGAAVLPAAAATPAAASHTLSFVSVTKNSINFTKKTGGAQGTDLSKAGKTVGFDQLYFTVTSSSGGVINATFDTKGGFIYATAMFNSGPVIHGKVTGGTGAFKGATGTLKAKNLNSAGTRTAITITYRT
jgi:hypothetical protein